MEVDVKAYMTGAPVSIQSDGSALEALDLMLDHAIRHLPVLDSAGRVCGIVSFEDLRAALPVAVHLTRPLDAADRRAALDVSVADAMTDTPVTIAADAPLEEAVTKMLEGRFGSLPIVDENGQLDGIVTQTDLLQALATVLWSEDRARG